MRAESSEALWVLWTRHFRALQRRTFLRRHDGIGIDAHGWAHRSVPSAHADGLAFEDAGPVWIVVSAAEPPGESERLAWSSCSDGV